MLHSFKANVEGEEFVAVLAIVFLNVSSFVFAYAFLDDVL